MPWPDRKNMMDIAELQGRADVLESGLGDLQSTQWIGAAYNTVTDSWVRLGSANGIAAGSSPACGLPILSPIFHPDRFCRVTLSDAGVETGEISWMDKRYYKTGALVDRSGGDGQVMVRYLPGYYRVGVTGNWIWIALSHLPLPGFTLFPLFEGMSAVYHGAYEASAYNGKLCSIALDPADGTSPYWPVTTRSGKCGHAGLTAQVTDEIAAARGAGWQQSDLLLKIWERYLQIVAFATFDVPAVCGAGRINLTGSNWINDELIGRIGLGDAVPGYHSGTQAGGTAGYLTDYVQCLGIENSWGNVWDRVASLVSDGALYYKPQPPYDYSTVTGWTRLLDAAGAGITLPLTSGYGGIPHNGIGIVFPKDVTGSSSTRMRDYYYYASGLRVLLVGGNSYNGAYAGPFYWNANASASSTSSNFGGRLCFKKAA